MTSAYPYRPGHILCPLDFSEMSDLALRYAAVAAHQFGAKLTLLHAERFDFPRYLSRDVSDRIVEEMKRSRLKVVEDLKRHVRLLLGKTMDSLSLDYAVEESSAGEAILQWQRGRDVDLVIMGTHGRSGWKRITMGSVTESVVRQINVPVFTIRPKGREFIDVKEPKSEPEISGILCPCAPGSSAQQPLDHAVSLAERFHAKLTVLRVRENGSGAKPEAEREEEVFRRQIGGYAGNDLQWTTEIRFGNAAEEIVRRSISEDTDMIVIGARARPFADISVFGQTTELVIRSAPCPVFIVPG